GVPHELLDVSGVHAGFLEQRTKSVSSFVGGKSADACSLKNRVVQVLAVVVAADRGAVSLDHTLARKVVPVFHVAADLRGDGHDAVFAGVSLYTACDELPLPIDLEFRESR